MGTMMRAFLPTLRMTAPIPAWNAPVFTMTPKVPEQHMMTKTISAALTQPLYRAANTPRKPVGFVSDLSTTW